MADNTMEALKTSTLIRVTVEFGGKSLRSLDEAFGRAAHVAFLEHAPFLRCFASRYSRFFRDD